MNFGKEDLYKLAESYDKKADSAFRAYQETGLTRYGTTYRKAEDMADALRVAAGAAEEHAAYINLKTEMSNLAWRAATVMRKDLPPEDRARRAESLIADIAALGRLLGLIAPEKEAGVGGNP